LLVDTRLRTNSSKRRRKPLINPADLESITQFLTAIGDPLRLQLLFVLGPLGRSNVGDITSHFRVSRPGISHHLKVLKDAGVVHSEKVGQEVFYWVDDDYVIANLRRLADAAERQLHSQ
jgi:ArsR family transcriptional regulator, arsenate/arsenite/antimonite-responsive transcriptional repressor